MKNLDSFKKVILTSLLIATPIFASAAGGADGGGAGPGGGKAFVCRDDHGRIKSVELLDLWEAENSDHPRKILRGSKLSLAENVENTISTIVDGLGSTSIGESKQQKKKYLMDQAQIFLRPNDKIVPNRGIRLTPTNDSYEKKQPRACRDQSLKGEIEQVVQYDDLIQKINVDQDIIDAMDRQDNDKVNHVGLIVHEALYAYLRASDSDNDSVRVRRAVGYALTGGSFKRPTLPSEVIRCSNDRIQNTYAWSDIVFFADTDPKNINYVMGSRMGEIALATNVRPLNRTQLAGEPGDDLFNEFFSNSPCTGLPTGILKSGPQVLINGDPDLANPVDFDRTIRLVLACKNGKPTMFMSKFDKRNFVDSVLTSDFQELTCGTVPSR